MPVPGLVECLLPAPERVFGAFVLGEFVLETLIERVELFGGFLRAPIVLLPVFDQLFLGLLALCEFRDERVIVLPKRPVRLVKPRPRILKRGGRGGGGFQQPVEIGRDFPHLTARAHGQRNIGREIDRLVKIAGAHRLTGIREVRQRAPGEVPCRARDVLR